VPARIIHWADKFGERSLLEHSQIHPSSVGDITPPAPGVALGIVVEARVSGGRWIADCPTVGCGGAEYVHTDELLLFCCECRNAQVGHQPILVVVPAAKTRAQIEAYLAARPAPATRNWYPAETVKQLRDENRAHGVRLVG
jgi:hypothetical protein